MFQFPAFAFLNYQESPAFSRRGCPIRTSADQRSHAPTRGFSQLAASFFAFRSLGIRRTPFSAFCRSCYSIKIRRTCLSAEPDGFIRPGCMPYLSSLLFDFFSCGNMSMIVCPPICGTKWRITDSNR